MNRCAVILVFCYLFIGTPGAKAQLILNSSDGLPDVGRSSAVWADFNNDGRMDIAIAGINSVGAKEAGVYFNNGNGTFFNSGIGLTPVSDGDMAVNDFNQDGWVDLLMTGVDASNARITKIYKNSGGGIFNELAVSFEGVSNGGIAFADLTNDGKPDVILNGLNTQNQSVTLLYVNNGNQTFTLKPTAIDGSSYGDLLVFDFNNDSYLDVLISGLNTNNQRVMNLYVNQGHGLFKKKETILPALRSGGLAAADMNNDGYADLFISGSQSGTVNYTAVYLNNKGSGFVLLKVLPGLYDGGGSWGDYNNDGYADLAIYGFDKVELKTTIYQNTNGTDLIDAAIPLPGAMRGLCSWVDYNNDKQLDFFLSGYSGVPFASLYDNDVAVANTLPSAPTNLKYTAYADSVVLSWNAATDHETSVGGLTYAVYIGTTSGAQDVKSPLANVTTGIRRLSESGSIKDTFMVIHKLPEAIYYWSVQSIDPAFGASPFANEKTFVSCSKEIITGMDQVCINSSLNLEAGSANDVVRWYSTINDNSLIGTGYQLDYLLKAQDTIVAKITKPLGCTVNDTMIVDVFSLPLVNTGVDKKYCLDNEVLLKATTNESIITWYEKGIETNVLSNTKEIKFNISRAITLVSKVEDVRGCINSDTVLVGLFSSPVVNLGNDKSVCFNTQVNWSVGAGKDSVNWFSKKEGALVKNNFNLSIKAQEADELWVEIYNESRCVSYDTVKLMVFSLPEVNAGDDKMICGDDAVNIGVASNGSGLTYFWSPSTSLSSENVATPLASPSVDTEYVLLITDQNNCVNKDTVWVYLNRPSTINLGGDASICFGDKITLGGNPTASGSTLPYTYNWSPGTGLNNSSFANPIASPKETITYELTTMAGACLVDVSSVVITVNPLPKVRASDGIVVGVQEGASISVEGALEYQWFPQEFFSNETSAHQMVYPNRTTGFWVRGKDINGCYNTDTVKVTVRSELFVPALFTPNEDGVNNIFRAHGFGVKNIVLKVYDRWGRILFESDSIEEGWDGRANGSPVEPGNYVWSVEGEFYDGTPLTYLGQQRGIIKLLR